MTKYIYDQNPSIGFTDLAKAVIQELEGAYGLLIKSVHYPHEVIAARKGSPLVIGVKTERRMKVDFVDVEYSDENGALPAEAASQNVALRSKSDFLSPNNDLLGAADKSLLHRSQSRAFMTDDGMPMPTEFFLSSDPSAIVEHTKKVMYLEDDDIAHIHEGSLNIHRLKKADGSSNVRTIQTLELELQEIMKGKFDHFMQKEIFEQPRAVADTLQDVTSIMPELFGDNAWRVFNEVDSVLLLACGGSYHAALTAKYWIESLAQLPVSVEIASAARNTSSSVCDCTAGRRTDSGCTAGSGSTSMGHR